MPVRKTQPAPLDVAIVGMECLLPQAPNLRAFWDNLINKVDAITEVPRRRFNIDLYYDSDRKARDKVYTRWGGFLDDVPFDPMRYGIPPNALASIDPMQLLSLVVVDRALRDAGYHDREFPRETTSVIFGLSGGLGDLGINYAVRSLLPHFIGKVPEDLLERLPEWTEDSFAGILLNVAAGRVANRFNLGGVNFTVDAACASSLAAVYLAARELRDGSSDMVIVGGVDTVQSPFGYLCFSKSQALSARGRCRTFDASADGIAISEGISVLVLKRLADAQEDGDRIYAVIKGVGGSSDGRGRSMTAPRPEGQELALDRAYQQARIRPASVGLIEAHGTGTIAGDATELAALAKVFQADGAAPHSCAVGSVKSMVGHTKSAAGVTGLMKVALALYHQVLPPTLHVEQPNSKLLEAESPLYIPTDAQPWIPPSGTPRRAGVSSFGFGGTNFHVVLEEHPVSAADSADRGGRTDWPAELFVWAGASAAALAATLAEPLGDGTLRALAFARANQTQPEGASMRLAVVASSREDLASKIAAARKVLLAGQETLDDPQGIYLGPVPESRAQIAFLFPGQGSQKPGMLRELALEFPEFRQSLERAEGVLAGRYPRPLSSYIYPPAAFTPEEKQRQMHELTDTMVAQPALGAVEIAYHRLLARLGVRPDMTAGHSYAEYVALCAAGVFSEETLLELSAARGRAIKESVAGDLGTMAAVSAEAAAVARALEGQKDVVLANYNAPRQTIIAGPTEAVKAAVAHLETAGLKAILIPVACAFHSPLMQPARDRLATALAAARFSSPAIPVFSNTLAAPYPQAPEEIAQVLTNHLTSPVRFVEEIEAMYAQGARLFVEVGPKGVLSGLARQILEGQDARILQTDPSDRSGLVQLLHVLAQLAVAGAAVALPELFRGRGLPETSEAPPAWLVNGSRAFPRTQPPAALEPTPLVSAATVSAQMPQKQPERPAPQPPMAQQVPVLPTTPAPGNADAVMLQFQQLMSQFLQTQAAVMTAFLSGSGAGAPLPGLMPAMPLPAAPVAQPAEPPKALPPVPAPMPAVEQTVATARRDFAAELRRIAGERTGYPIEMLDPDAAIEADLGIDSIKRTEILSAFQRGCSAEEQKRVQAVLDTLTSARTLREISDRISAALAGGQVKVSAPAQPAAEVVPRFQLVAVEQPRRQVKPQFYAGRVCLITDDETGVASSLAEEIKSAGERAVLLRHSSDITIAADGVFSTNLTDPAAIQGVVEDVRRQYGTIGAMIHLFPLRTGPTRAQCSLADWHEQVQQDVKSLYALARAIETDLKQIGRAGGALLAVATARGGEFGLKPDAGAPPTHYAVADFTKTLALEFPGVLLKVVDLDPSDPVPILREKLFHELTSQDETLQVGLPGDRRLTVMPRIAPVNPEPVRRIGHDWVFLLTGGARGITAEIARLLAQRYRPTLILAGASPQPAESESLETSGIQEPAALKAALMVRLRATAATVKPAEVEAAYQRLLKRRQILQTLEDLRRHGARVEYHSVDVRDEAAFGGLIERIYQNHGRLDVVIHGAGIIEDKLIRDKSPESFDRVVHTKADSAFLLSRALRLESLQCLLFMSSITAAFGNRGQADYAAANGIMNGLAVQLSAEWPCRVAAMNWGPWDQSGMVTEEMRQQFLSRGVYLVPPAGGAEATLREIEAGDPQEPVIAFGDGPWAASALPAAPAWKVRVSGSST